MRYTQNHHLPQWEETDRVLMADFNAAMAATEAGLNAAEETAAENLLERLDWLSRDLYHAIARGGSGQRYASHWGGSYYFPFTTDSNAFDREGLSWRDGYLTLGADTAWSGLEVTKDGTGIGMYIAGNPNNGPTSLTFTCPGNGRITSIRVGFIARFTSSDPNEYADVTMRLDCQRKKNGQYQTWRGPYEFTTHLTRENSGIRNADVPVDLLLVGGGEYRLVLSWVSGGYDLKFVFGDIKLTDWPFTCTLEAGASVQGKVRETITVPASAQRATALVRYSGDGSVTATLGGQAFTLTDIHPCAVSDGTACTEAELRLTAPLPDGQQTAEVQAHCPTGNMRVYDMGFTLV